MNRSRFVDLVVVALLALAVLVVLTGPGGPLAGLRSPLEYDHASVTVRDENGTRLATVDVRVADTERERYVGLSRNETLAAGEGMLFVHEREGQYAYVMRNMSVPLDIVFVDANGTITAIHHAPVAETPADPERQYRGRGRYVLEVPYEWTSETGIAVGDQVEIPDPARR